MEQLERRQLVYPPKTEDPAKEPATLEQEHKWLLWFTNQTVRARVTIKRHDVEKLKQPRYQEQTQSHI